MSPSLARIVPLLLVLAPVVSASPPLEEARSLVLEARRASRDQDQQEAFRKMERAARVLEKALRRTEPVETPQLTELVRAYRDVNDPLLRAYREAGDRAAFRTRCDAIMTLLEGRLREAHRIDSELVEEVARDYHELIRRRIEAARQQGDTPRVEELGHRFLGVVEGLVGATHGGNQHWLRPLLEAYSKAVREKARELQQAGRTRDLHKLLDRAEGVLRRNLGVGHPSLEEIRKARARVPRD